MQHPMTATKTDAPKGSAVGVAAVIGGVVLSLMLVPVLIVLPIVQSMTVLPQQAGMILHAMMMCSGTTVDQQGLAGGFSLSTPGSYSVMSWNLRGGTNSATYAHHPVSEDFKWSVRGPQIQSWVETINADIVGFQEVGGIGGKVRDMVKGLDGYSMYGEKSTPIVWRTSKFSRTSGGYIQLSWRSDPGGTGNKFATWVKLTDLQTGAPLLVVNLHAQYNKTPATAQTRKLSWERLKKGLEHINPGNKLPATVMGDFNAGSNESRGGVWQALFPAMRSMGLYDSAVTTPVQTLAVDGIRSYNGWGKEIGGSFRYKAIRTGKNGPAYIDYIWHNSRLSPTMWQIYVGPVTEWRSIGGRQVAFAEAVPSDHWPVLAKLTPSTSGGSTVTTLSADKSSAQTQIGALNKSASVPGFTSEQIGIAVKIVEAGQALGLDAWTITVGIMTGIGESSLRNIDYGDEAGPDSRGVFQQRDGWGSLADRMNPTKAATKFFKALIDVPGYRQMTPTAAADATQRNANPNHYAKFWPDAVQIMSAIAPAAAGLIDLNSAPTGGDLVCSSLLSSVMGDGPIPTAYTGEAPPSGSAAENGLQPSAKVGLRAIAHTFPKITRMGGLRKNSSTCSFSDHCKGLAVDFMIDGWRTQNGKAYGWQVARWVQANAAALNVKMIIWDAKTWKPGDKQWRAYRHPYGNQNPTLAHLDHVHVSFKG